MNDGWHEGNKVVQDARETVLSALESAGWNVVRIASGEAYYTTPAGRIGTICLHAYSGLPRVWRWHLDHHTMRVRGQNTSVSPNTIDGGPGRREFSCDMEELAVVADWLSRWLVAHDRGVTVPIPPVDIERPGNRDWGGNNVWTLAANLQRPLNKAVR